MRQIARIATTCAVGLTGLAIYSTAHAAQDQQISHEEIEQLKQRIAEQRRLLTAQEQDLRDQSRRLEALITYIDSQNQPQVQQAAYVVGGEAGNARDKRERAAAANGYTTAQATQQPVGEAPGEQSKRPQVPVIPEKGGILTKRGTLIVEPSLEFQHNNVNRFTAGGVAILDTVLIGVIEATQADRDSITAAVTGRYGITNRFEIEGKVPFVYRNDRTTNTVIETPATQAEQSLSNANLGDIEVAAHYQFNDGNGLPYFVGNLRVKSDTGTSPFNVSRNNLGIETDLPTGSGFWAVEPSITAIFPSDPVVFYGNLGYLLNFERDINKTYGTGGDAHTVGTVNPGDAIRASLGMGIALNEKVSVSLGYSHDFINNTWSRIDGIGVDSEELDVGSLNIGTNYQFSDRVGLNMSLSMGVTEDAPDVSLLMRVPISIDLF